MEADALPRLEGYMRLETPVLLIVAGDAYEGHVLGVVATVVIAYCRPLGTREQRQEYRWPITDIDDAGPAEPPEAMEPEDPLLALGRDLAGAARERKSVAEQLAEDHARRSTLHDL